METVLVLRSNQTLRPVVDLSSVYQRRNALGKHQMISCLPIGAHSRRRSAYSVVNLAPSPDQPIIPRIPERRNAKDRDPNSESKSVLQKTWATLSGILHQKTPTINKLSQDYNAQILEQVLLRKFSPDNKDNFGEDDYLIGLVFVNNCIAMKEYQKAKEMCEALDKYKSRFDARPLLQKAVIETMLAMEKMSETEPYGKEAIEKIEAAMGLWKEYLNVCDFGKSPDLPK